MKETIQKVCFAVLLVLVLAKGTGIDPVYQMAGWVTGISSSDYEANRRPSGTVVYNDLTAITGVLNGAVSDTNMLNMDGSKLLDSTVTIRKLDLPIADSSNVTELFADSTFNWDALDSLFRANTIALGKLRQGVLHFGPNCGAAKVMAYGDAACHWANVQAAYNLQDTLCPDSTYVLYIDFSDSSDVGDPSFSAAPTVDLSPIYSPAVDVSQGTYVWYTAALHESLHYHIRSIAAGGCSLYFHFTANDTIFNGLTFFWEARE